MINMNIIKRLLGKEDNHKISYAQCGEDLIVSFIFSGLKMSDWTYLDIGAHHPTQISNTYLFYKQGHRGVCVEPDPILFAEILRVRGEDVCLNVGVGVNDESAADFFIMSSKSLNTFSKADAERYGAYHQENIEKVVRLPLVSINSLAEKYFKPHPNFISVDIEGLDFEVLKTFDFDRFRTEVFCVETLTYTTDKSERKMNEIIDLMTSAGYFTYADTYINTIFVKRDSWAAR
jgi:FkbM family methyltransferase